MSPPIRKTGHDKALQDALATGILQGAILEGSDADIIVLNPNASFRISAISHHSRSDTNVYEGKTGKGKVEVTISGGRVVWEEGNLKITSGSGKYIKMPPFSYLFDGIDKADAAYLASLRSPVHRTAAAY
ncbi:dihydropyrimidinase [Dendrobium catenatum]|uniref:Dihydropyrimidinase n=1 Tax=Dendrobium catenatum TaxID=906689 RepID=A0A2I0V8R1_9ASPA|nr:dihydropyrimidinase [Dendrobium catenatum]